jgi:hypothetical protein
MSLGQIAYEAYKASRSNKTHDGKPMPTWDELGTVQLGWEAAARTVAEHIFTNGIRSL